MTEAHRSMLQQAQDAARRRDESTDDDWDLHIRHVVPLLVQDLERRIETRGGREA